MPGLFRVSTILAAALLLFASPAKESRDYPGPKGERVAVRSTMKVEATPESNLEFYGGRQLFCALDYTSEDGEHGYGLEKAAWTPDGNFFVASFASSGGHQPWHAPTIAYGREQKWIIDLDDFIDGLGISGTGFKVAAPHTILAHMLKEENRQVAVRLNLEDLFRKAMSAKNSKGIACMGGSTRKAGAHL